MSVSVTTLQNLNEFFVFECKMYRSTTWDNASSWICFDSRNWTLGRLQFHHSITLQRLLLAWHARSLYTVWWLQVAFCHLL